MTKCNIKNRKGQKVVVVVEEPTDPKGLAFVMHGLGGFKEQPHVQTFAAAFLQNDYTAVRFDTTNSLGESDGKYEDATTTNYYEDLEDVITWAKTQSWYKEPFVLCGHSLGGISTAWYAEKFPDKVKALAPISTVVSGKISLESSKNKEWRKWKETGWYISRSSTPPYVEKRLKWFHIEDRLKYNLMPKVEKLTMPVLMIVGENDDSTPPEHQKVFYDSLPGRKEMHIIKNAPHTFKEQPHLEEIKALFNQWIKKLT
ncbi:MAG: alpha/beta hydrolase [Patescibacteria group bacterium]